jgi:hypothetical protein
MSWERFKEIVEYIGMAGVIVALWIFIFLIISHIGIMIYEAIQ